MTDTSTEQQASQTAQPDRRPDDIPNLCFLRSEWSQEDAQTRAETIILEVQAAVRGSLEERALPIPNHRIRRVYKEVLGVDAG